MEEVRSQEEALQRLQQQAGHDPLWSIRESWIFLSRSCGDGTFFRVLFKIVSGIEDEWRRIETHGNFYKQQNDYPISQGLQVFYLTNK